MAILTLWSAESAMDAPTEVLTLDTAAPASAHVKLLDAQGWQHVADGPDGSKVFARADTLAMIEIKDSP